MKNWDRLLILPFVALAAEAAAAGPVTVRLEVRFPAVAMTDTLYLSGNLPEVGGWEAAGVPLTRVDSSHAVAELVLPPRAPLDYKITRGTWATVEKARTGEEIPNRRFDVPDRPAGDVVLQIEVEAWADSAPPRPSTQTGDIRFHESFESKHLGNRRTIAVYLPPGYDTGSRRYPVLYAHDGQNIFDAATSFAGAEWEIDETCERLIPAGDIPPVIVVGVYNTSDRVAEYTPTADPKRGGGRGKLYGRFLVDEVKPFIDATYRTLSDRTHTAVMGSSLGGLMTLHLLWEYPDIFSRGAAVSPALWWANRDILRSIKRSRGLPNPDRVWIDMGTREGLFPDGHLKDINDMADVLSKKGLVAGKNFVTFIDQDADHSERAWARRVEPILKFLYKN